MIDELSPEGRAALDAGRDDGAPSAEDRERVRRRIVATLGVGAFGTLGAASKASAAAAIGEAGSTGSTGIFTGVPTAAKLVLAAAGVAVGLGVGLVAMRPTPAEPPANAPPASVATALTTPAPVVAPPPATAVPIVASPEPAVEAHAPAPNEVPAPPRPTGSGAKRPAAPVWTPGSPLEMTRAHAPTLQPELALIGAAQAALGGGDTAGALEHLDRHAERFPDGVLAQERMAARAIALCRLERLEAGRTELARLDREAPRSPLLARVRSECAR